MGFNFLKKCVFSVMFGFQFRSTVRVHVKMDGNFLHVFGVGKLGHEPFVTLSRLFHGLFYPIFKVREGMK